MLVKRKKLRIKRKVNEKVDRELSGAAARTGSLEKEEK